MNANTMPKLEQQLDGLMTTYENAQVAAAQAPDIARATLNSQVEIIELEIEKFFKEDAVVAALDELSDLRTAEYEQIGEMFANGEITDSELDERIEAIEKSPKYRLLGLATELGAFALDTVTVEEVEETEEADPEFKPFVPVEITTEKIEALAEDEDVDLEPEELELISEVTQVITAIEPETVVFAETDEYTEDEVETVVLDEVTLEEIDVAFEALSSDLADPEEVFFDEEVVPSEEPILPEIDEDIIVDTVEIDRDEPSTENEPENEVVTLDHALIFTEEVAEISKDKDDLKSIAPKHLLRTTLKHASEKDMRYITPEERRKAIRTILEALDSEDALLELITRGESSPEMFDFADYASSIVEKPMWKAIKSELLQSIHIEEESPVRPATTASISREVEIEEVESSVPETTITEEPQEEIAEVVELAPVIAEREEEKVETEAVTAAVEVLAETDNLFEGEISLGEFTSRTGINTEVFIDVYRSGILELEDHEKQVAIKEIKINAAEAILLQMHATNPELLTNADDTAKSRILSSVKSELSKQDTAQAA